MQTKLLPVTANAFIDECGGVANMTTTMRTTRTALLAATLAGALLSLPQVSLAAASGSGANAKNRLNMIMQCAAHVQHHIGQMIYLGYEWQHEGAKR